MSDKHRKNPTRIVVYTAIFGKYDCLHEPAVITPGCRYVCFTDSPFRSETWEVIRARPTSAGPIRDARRHKILAHRFFPDAQYSVWIDGQFAPNCDVTKLIQRYLAREDMALYAHPGWSCIYAEAKECIRQGRDDKEVIQSQIAGYKAQGYPEQHGLVATGILLRKHTQRVSAFNEAWWLEVETKSYRDQLSFNYIARRTGMTYATISEGNVYVNQYFLWHSHTQLPHPAVCCRRRFNEGNDSRKGN